MRKRGEIWLADLTPRRGTKPGKTRPVLIVQAQALLDAEHPSTVVVPLTTRLVDAEPLRIRIRASGSLKKDSDALIDQVRAIDNRRLVQGPLSRLPPQQLDVVAHALLEVLDLARPELDVLVGIRYRPRILTRVRRGLCGRGKGRRSRCNIRTSVIILYTCHYIRAHMTTTLSVRIDSDTKNQLEALAKRARRSKSFLAAEAIAAYVEAERWQLDEIQAGLQELDKGRAVAHGDVSKWLRTWGKKRERKAPRA